MKKPKLLKSKTFPGLRSIDYVQQIWTLDGKKTFGRDLVDHPGAVAVFCVKGKGNRAEILLQRQFRYSIRKELWEVPAGTMDPKESPRATAIRELREETGYRPGLLKKFGRVFPAPGYCNEIIHFFEARELHWVGQDLDEGELIGELRWLSLDEMKSWIHRGKIQDSKTIAGFLKWMLETK